MRKWWGKYGAWVIGIAFIVLAGLRLVFLPPIPEKYMWTDGVFLLALFGVIAYFSFRKPKDPD